ncbi:hypothetical protein M885DRAFT_618032 [Pelagophyceae sp. CCMP2097]|nr:hypothetical protein M885DRAFT_618032 [Pelagophyceae sp. CCMP2097]
MGGANSYEKAAKAATDVLTTLGPPFAVAAALLRGGAVPTHELLLPLAFGDVDTLRALFLRLHILDPQHHDTLLGLVYGARNLEAVYKWSPPETILPATPLTPDAGDRAYRAALAKEAPRDPPRYRASLARESPREVAARPTLQRTSPQSSFRQSSFRMPKPADDFANVRDELPEWSNRKLDHGKPDAVRVLPARPKSAGARSPTTGATPRLTKKCRLQKEAAAAKMTAYSHSQKPHMRLGVPLPGQLRHSALSRRFSNPRMEPGAAEHYVDDGGLLDAASLARVWTTMEIALLKIADPAARSWMRLYTRFNEDGSGRLTMAQFRLMARNNPHQHPSGLALSKQQLPEAHFIALWTILDKHRSGGVLIDEWALFCRNAHSVCAEQRALTDPTDVDDDDDSYEPRRAENFKGDDIDNVHAQNIYKRALARSIYLGF